ncbi:MAG: glycoside hydrolase family 2 TIM barrel-domain containing protein [Puniceicoccaceae bacterium]
MKTPLHIFLITSICILLLEGIAHAGLPYGYPDTDRSRLRINDGWKFHLGDPDAKYFRADLDDSGWETVNAPHTLKLTSLSLDNLRDEKTQLIFHRDVGWYRRDIEVEPDSSKRVFLEFEGAHQVTDVWVNGKHVGQHAVGGYTPFHFDISEFVNYGTVNQVTLRLDNRRRDDVPPDPGPFDYVKFGGLYRDVYLVHKNSLHIQFNWERLEAGITVTTPSVDVLNKNATTNIKTGVVNSGSNARTISAVSRVIDKDGFVVLKLVSEATVPAGGEYTFNQIGGIEENLELWGIDHPYLYRVNCMLVENGKEIDAAETRIGVRTFELDPEEGFKLNGKVIELIGMNRHQHYGFIGDAMPDSLHYKDMLQFKELGFNVMRTAHYPQDNAIMDACDELGILAYEEAPTWIAIGNDAWMDNLEKGSRIMVRNHRNHPSLVIWGAGINHRGYVPRLHYAIKQEDPNRLTASQNSRWTGWQTSGVTDIYGNMNYGPVVWDRQEQLLAMEAWHGAEEVAKYKRDQMMPGIISWTAHGYYTFHENWDWEPGQSRIRFGVLTEFRHPKEKVFWYPSEMTDAPMVHIESDWSADAEGIEVYSNCEEVEVLVNGESRGVFQPSDDPIYMGLDHPPILIKSVPFEAGKLTVNGLIDGEVFATQTIHTPGEAVAVKLIFDTAGRDWKADGADIVVGHAYIVDANGTTIESFEGEVEFSVSGDATIIGDASIGANPFPTRIGMAPVLVKAGSEPEKVVVTARVKGLKSGKAELASVSFNPDMIVSLAQPIYDMRSLKVDMGAADQLVQFDWIPWNGEDNAAATMEIPWAEGATVSVGPASENGIIRWLGEMNVLGKFAFVYGEGVLGVDENGLVMEFHGLPKGNYAVKTYHHAPRSNTDEMDPNQEKLKDQNIVQMPYAKKVQVSVQGREKVLSVTEGKDMQYATVATTVTGFTSDGKNPVKVVFKNPDGQEGIWLNGFELSERP